MPKDTARRALLGALLAAPRLAGADTPTRSIRLISPYTPGGGTDVTARLLAAPLTRLLGQAIVVENRPGAGGTIGAAEVARAAPDGTTLLVDAAAHTVNPSLMRNPPLDYATAFAPISQLTRLPQVMIAPKGAAARTLAEFVAHARAHAGRLAFGSSGNGSGAQLASVLFLRAAGLEVEHVPYRGGSAAMQAVMAGDVAFAFATVNTATQLIRDGQLLAYAVAADRRVAALPEIPTLAEAGYPGCELYEWNGLFAPAGTPAALVARLHAAVAEALRDPTVAARFAEIGAEPLGTSPAEFAAFLAAQFAAMAVLVREAGITLG